MTSYQKEQIHRMRSKAGYSKIAACLGISENTIKSYCRRNNLSGMVIVSKLDKQSSEKEGQAYCLNCGKPIEQCPGVKPRKFCSDKCRMVWWNSHKDMVVKKAIYHLECAYCKKPFESYGNKNRKYCGHACYIKDRFR